MSRNWFQFGRGNGIHICDTRRAPMYVQTNIPLPRQSSETIQFGFLGVKWDGGGGESEHFFVSFYRSFDSQFMKKCVANWPKTILMSMRVLDVNVIMLRCSVKMDPDSPLNFWKSYFLQMFVFSFPLFNKAGIFPWFWNFSSICSLRPI